MRNIAKDSRVLLVTPAPHLRTKTLTKHIMRDVLLALLPAVIAAGVLFRVRALILLAVCVVVSVASEFIYRKLLKQTTTISDLSAAVTGLLLGLTLPRDVPFWIAGIGCVFAIVVVKQLFGGLGKNFANPALVGRIVLLISFPMHLITASPTRFETLADAASYATPFHLQWVPNAVYPTRWELFLGVHGGAIGETCILALLIGLLYLVFRNIITITTPLSYIATVFLLSIPFGKDPVFEIMTGGLVLGAIFMATDYVCTPTTEMGRLVFGLGAGAITVLLRRYSHYPEGVSFAILLMNLLTPLIEKLTRIRAFGEPEAKRKKREAEVKGIG